MSDLLEEIFAEMLTLRYGERDRAAAATMARFAMLTIQPQPERKRRKSVALDAGEGGSPELTLPGDQMPDIPPNLRRAPR